MIPLRFSAVLLEEVSKQMVRVRSVHYPGYPGPLSRQDQILLGKRLEEVFKENPQDSRKLEDLWRILIEGKGPRVKLPRPRFRGTYP